ncbi:hypothetical protein SAMN05660489_04553 [Pseudomonas sp. LAMO17WK12:I10]|uniref:hypothetical protein n=1 Tax=unclassified Pseudomonas TaxID=196821 RepID=UPI000BD54664|nr:MULTISPECIES: hypothetical protein [unclassified Pseudomonas]PXX59528.1 hypothetical protein H160_04648 [Pseudomonas sp. LAMO17WK12:I9]SNY46740.1 hypothetical protein SAMN05660489_04553 [Pseudomonas sp. LAMO17WK12:I10]
MKTVDQRLHELEQAVNTIPSAILNMLMAVVSSLNKLEPLDKEALRNELEDLKSVQIRNGNQVQYVELIDHVLARLS